MRVAVIGSGGVGGFVGGKLAQAGHEVAFLARGEHLRALQTIGLRVQSTGGDFEIPSVTATEQAAALGPADLFLFTVKSYDTDEAAALLKPLLGAAEYERFGRKDLRVLGFRSADAQWPLTSA